MYTIILLLWIACSTLVACFRARSYVSTPLPFEQARRKCALENLQLPDVSDINDPYIRKAARKGKGIWLGNQRNCSKIKWIDGRDADDEKECQQDCVAFDIKSCTWTCAECRTDRDGFACAIPDYDCNTFKEREPGVCINNEYKFPIVVMHKVCNFHQSSRHCSEYGGLLATLEKDDLVSFCKSTLELQSKIADVWLGAYRCTWGLNEQDWLWLPGQPVANEHRCLILRRSGLHFGLEAVNCNYNFSFMCIAPNFDATTPHRNSSVSIPARECENRTNVNQDSLSQICSGAFGTILFLGLLTFGYLFGGWIMYRVVLKKFSFTRKEKHGSEEDQTENAALLGKTVHKVIQVKIHDSSKTVKQQSFPEEEYATGSDADDEVFAEDIIEETHFGSKDTITDMRVNNDLSQTKRTQNEKESSAEQAPKLVKIRRQTWHGFE